MLVQLDPPAVEFDLVQPLLTARRSRAQGRNARRNLSNEGTRQDVNATHEVGKITITNRRFDGAKVLSRG
jgi:hypothetical protein